MEKRRIQKNRSKESNAPEAEIPWYKRAWVVAAATSAVVSTILCKK